MGYRSILYFSIFIQLCYCEGFLGQALLQQENDVPGVTVFVQRGTGGIQGRDGPQGRCGTKGRDGTPNGPRGERGLQGIQGPRGTSGGGATYTRWGSSTCPNVTDTTIIYSGITGGTQFTQVGGAANHLCLPEDPEYSKDFNYRDNADGYSPVHGAEYEVPVVGKQDHDIPCAVCTVSSRSNIVMIPAKASCPSKWTKEYRGYLMSDHISHKRSTFECVDESMESLSTGQGSANGALLYHSEAHCGTGLICPPFNAGNELNCVVCTM